MISATLLVIAAGWVSEAPRQARLLTPAQVELADITDLTVAQLRSEELRLEEPRSIAPAKIVLGLGIAVSVAALALAGGAFALTRGPANDVQLLGAFMAVLAVGFGITGAAAGNVGGVMMPVMNQRRDAAAERYAAVRLRLQEIESGKVPEPELTLLPPETVAVLERLEAQRPRLVVPLSLVAAGAGATMGAVWGLAFLPKSSSVEEYALLIVLTCAGIAVGGIGTIRLVDAVNQRAEIDAQIELLQRTSLPPAPIALSYRWEL